jgi:transcriptional regulator with XRE-family HTH domain/Zn-dependent peptidase ImmA (M78 family)
MVPPRERSNVDAGFPLRLRAARLRAGLSLGELAEKLGGIVSRQAIAKYEKGVITPSPEVLERLRQVLTIPPPQESFAQVPDMADAPMLIRSAADRRASCARRLPGKAQFLGDMDVPYIPEERTLFSRAERLLQDWDTPVLKESELVLRPEPRLPAKQLSALGIELGEKFASYLRLETLLNLSLKFASPFRGRPLREARDVEEAALKTRQLWDMGTGPLVNILDLLDEKGVKTFKLAGPDLFESVSGEFRGHPFIAVRGDMPLDRLRFKASAELAQVLFGFSGEPEVLRLYNRFAAAFLLPARRLEEYFPPAGRNIAFGELEAVKLRYGISIQAVMYRAFDLGLVTERRLRSFREMMKEKGWLSREPVEYRGEENPTRFKRLLHYAVSSEILELKAAAALAGTTPEQLSREMGEIF